MAWSNEEGQESVLFVVDAARRVHTFDVTIINQAWPRRTLLILTVLLAFLRRPHEAIGLLPPHGRCPERRYRKSRSAQGLNPRGAAMRPTRCAQ